MKLYKLSSFALLTMLVSSCAVNDPFADKGELGQYVPTVNWEQNSTLVPAGGYASFKAQYYNAPGAAEIDHSAVWASVKRQQSATATSKLTTALSYTKTYAVTDTVRTKTQLAEFAHSDAKIDYTKRDTTKFQNEPLLQYVLTDSFPTSRTYKPIAWATPTQWDANRFHLYYYDAFPGKGDFAADFCAHMVETLTSGNTYYNDLRNIYINYGFSAEQFTAAAAAAQVSFPTDTATDAKSNLWFVNTGTVDHYYYTTVDDKGNRVYHEISNKADAPQGVNVYDVYKSAPWIFSRYDDNAGGAVTTIRDQYMPVFRYLLQQIPFVDWIYDSVNKNYAINYSCTYYLQPEFRVYDKDGKVGVTTDNKDITLN